MHTEFGTLAVIGSGTMGHGIAYVAAMSGLQVRLHDADAAALERARARVEQTVRGGIERKKLTEQDRETLWERLTLEPDFEAAVRDAEVVIEAIVEDVGAKQRVFAAVEGLVSESAVLASNTSSLSIGAIASALAHPERVIGMHFFNPVHLMKLVEVVVADGTSDEARAAVLGLATQMGKEPIVVSDSPGFASSRLGVVLGLEAMRMLEQGVAGADDIDKAMELGYRHPMGPLRVSDLVGLDVRLAIADHLHRELGGDQYRAPEILRAKVQTGELGKKTGKGFYTWAE